MKEKSVSILFIAPPGARNKRESIFKEMVSLYPEADFSQILYLAPNTTVLTEAKKRFFAYLKKERKKSAYIPFQALTVRQLAMNFYETAPHKSDFLAISEHMRTLILSEMLKEKNIGYAQLLSDLFRKIRHYAPDQDLSQLKEEIGRLIFEEKTRARALKALDLLHAYENFLQERKLLDPEDMLKICLPPNPYPLIPAPCSLVIDGFFDPTPLEMKLIKALLEKAHNVFILAEEDTELLSHLQSYEGLTIEKLPRGTYRENTGYYSYPSMEEEVEGIAKNVKKLILGGLKPWEITICFPSLSQYLPMLRRIFKKHGVTASIGEYNLSATKPLLALYEIMACIENDYPRNDFLALLTAPCFPEIPELVREWAVAFSYRAGVIKGKTKWLSIEKVLLKSDEDDMSEEEKKTLAEFQRQISQIIATLEKINQSRDTFLFINAFEAALNKFGFFDYPDNLPASRSIANIFTELRQWAGLSISGLQDSDPAFHLKYLLQDLKAADEDSDGVKILPFELAAGVETKALFFGGMIEGSFPHRPEIDPILPEKVKKELGLPYLEYYLNRQKHYFRRLLDVSILDPYFSCPSAEGDKVFLPSPFLDWEKMMTPPDLNIFTEEEVLTRENAAGLAPGVFGAGDMSFDKESFGILRNKIGAMAKGYFRVTDIDFYRKCPLRFYIERVLRLEMEGPPRFEVEHKLWGILAHKTMERLFKQKDWELDEFEKKLFSCLEESLKEFPLEDFWTEVAREIFIKLLPLLKNQETDIRAQGFMPYKIEETIKAEIDVIRLKGKIDRVDLKRGEGQGADSVILLDYKTGSVDKDSLQLPLYAKMWLENFPEPVEKVGYYSLKDGNTAWYPKKITMEEFINAALQKTEELVRNLQNGLFPAEPENQNECRHCYHKPMCEKG